MRPVEIARVGTDLFNHREVKPHFINDCCFGEDFAAWLVARLSDLSREGFAIGGPIQEDYGWGFWIRHGKDRFWIALSYVGDGPTEEPGEWDISIAHHAGFKLLGRPDSTMTDALVKRIRRELDGNPGLEVR